MGFLTKILTSFHDNIIANLINWLVTAIITFFTVKYATKQFYYKTRVETSKSIMQFGIESMLNLVYGEPLPDTAKVIFVEYGKRSIFLRRKQIEKLKKVGYRGRSLRANLRKTIAVCGNSKMDISSYKPINYGVLGVANILESIVAFDFNSGELYKFTNGEIVNIPVHLDQEEYYCLEIDSETYRLSHKNESERAVMIAVPIIEGFSGSPLLGGITFDMQPGEKTLYQKIASDDSSEQKKFKEDINKKVFQSAKTTAECLKTTYFKRKKG